jgi:hypothetical protein
LLESELSAGAEQLAGIATRSSEPGADTASVVALHQPPSSDIGGYAGVLGPEVDNEECFRSCLSDKIGAVVGGGSTCLFCYGYTGSGKTHTVLGPSPVLPGHTVLGHGEEEHGRLEEPEHGLFFLAAQQLLARLNGTEAEGKDGSSQAPYFLIVTAAEVYGDRYRYMSSHTSAGSDPPH